MATARGLRWIRPLGAPVVLKAPLPSAGASQALSRAGLPRPTRGLYPGTLKMPVCWPMNVMQHVDHVVWSAP